MVRSRQRHPVRLLLARIWLLVLIAVLAALIHGVWSVYQKERETRQNRLEAEARYTELQQRQEGLRTDIASLQSERELEAQLRQQYDVGREGEHLLVIVEEEGVDEAANREHTGRIRDFFERLWPF